MDFSKILNTHLESNQGLKKNSFSKANKRFQNFLDILNDSIDNYLNDYRGEFSNFVFDPMITEFQGILNKYYKNKIESFENFEDQIKELNMLLDGNENNESNNTIKLMIDNLLIEKKNVEDEILVEHENMTENFIETQSKKDFLSKNENISKMNNTFKSKIQQLIINNEIKN